MDLGLERTAAVVGGASSGMGLAIAEALAAEGCAVTMLARTPDKLQQAAARIPGAIGVPRDGRDQGAPEHAGGRAGAQRARGPAGARTSPQRDRADIIVNSAGRRRPGTFESTRAEGWAEA